MLPTADRLEGSLRLWALSSTATLVRYVADSDAYAMRCSGSNRNAICHCETLAQALMPAL